MKFADTKTSEFRFKLYPQDFQRVKAFYRDTLFFPIVLEWDNAQDDQGVMFHTGTAIIELLSVEHYKPVVGCSVSLEIANVWELWKRFENFPTLVHHLRDNDWGDTSFAITDPEGLVITFFTKR